MSFLKIQNLNQTLGKKQILKNVSIQADRGQLVAFLGPNGAGKTTLLKTIVGLYPTPKISNVSSTGKKTNQIFLDNTLINYLPIHKRVEMGIVYLPQQTSLFQQMSVSDNLQLVYDYNLHWKNKDQKDFDKEKTFWLETTNLTETLKQKAITLSGGQKRKLEVVRSILMHPKIILLDEPFAGVDPKSIYELKKIFQDMAHKDKVSVLISDHNVDQLLSIADLTYVLINGKIITSGDIKKIINNKDTKEMYLGNQLYSEISQRFLK